MQPEDESGDSDSDKSKIASPRDIYGLFVGPSEPKSILKNLLQTSTSATSATTLTSEEAEHNQTRDIFSSTPKVTHYSTGASGAMDKSIRLVVTGFTSRYRVQPIHIFYFSHYCRSDILSSHMKAGLIFTAHSVSLSSFGM